ncbi:MAG: HIT family protein [Nanobdellota archaeon]
MDCIFCKIIQDEIPGEKLYENENTLAIMDINPANKGHVLVIPKEHYETFTDLPDEIAAGLSKTTKKMAEAVNKATKTEGFNIVINNKKVAGQLVPHVHFHIIPRYENDGIDMSVKHKKYEDGELEDYAEKIRNNL